MARVAHGRQRPVVGAPALMRGGCRSGLVTGRWIAAQGTGAIPAAENPSEPSALSRHELSAGRSCGVSERRRVRRDAAMGLGPAPQRRRLLRSLGHVQATAAAAAVGCSGGGDQ
eukprot:gene10396-7392_t